MFRNEHHYVAGQVKEGMKVLAPVKRDSAHRLEPVIVLDVSVDGLVAIVETTGKRRVRVRQPFAVCLLRRLDTPRDVNCCY